MTPISVASSVLLCFIIFLSFLLHLCRDVDVSHDHFIATKPLALNDCEGVYTSVKIKVVLVKQL